MSPHAWRSGPRTRKRGSLFILALLVSSGQSWKWTVRKRRMCWRSSPQLPQAVGARSSRSHRPHAREVRPGRARAALPLPQASGPRSPYRPRRSRAAPLRSRPRARAQLSRRARGDPTPGLPAAGRGPLSLTSRAAPASGLRTRPAEAPRRRAGPLRVICVFSANTFARAGDSSWIACCRKAMSFPRKVLLLDSALVWLPMLKPETRLL
jgi:hypothetical protein